MKRTEKSKPFKLLALMLSLIFVLGTFTACGDKKDKEITTTTTEPTTAPPTTEAEVIRNPLTGEPNYEEALVKNRPVLVSVENHPDARPQWGLTSSDIVWEMVAEGGITRMLLMYADSSRLPDKIGPTRSARHYFVEIAEGFNAIFVHFGGSPLGYSYINNHGVDNIDGMSDSGFSRDSSRGVSSEHTAYTTKDGVINNIEKKDYRTTLEDEYVNPFEFNNKAVKLKDGSCTEITVPHSSSYTYKYTYNADESVYYSTLNGNRFMDDNGTQQHFENVIVLYANITSLGDSKGRMTIDFSNGDGVYASNGTYQNITWEKGDADEMVKLFDTDGTPLKLNQGRSYIAIIDDGKTASIS